MPDGSCWLYMIIACLHVFKIDPVTLKRTFVDKEDISNLIKIVKSLSNETGAISAEVLHLCELLRIPYPLSTHTL